MTSTLDNLSLAQALELMGGGDCRLQRHSEMNAWMVAGGSETAPLMGTAFRQVLTGEVRLERVPKRLDYTVVDLWTRPCLLGKIKQFVYDRYLFKPVPMTYRTWIYHSLYRGGMIQADTGEDLMTTTLKQHCIDQPETCGRFSPALMYFPSCLGAALTGDKVFVTICVVVAALLHRLAAELNVPKWYRYNRLASLPFRAIFIFYLLARIGGDFTNVLGTFIVLVGAIADIVLGDVRQLTSCNLICQYEIVRELPNRVFVCRRIGAISTNLNLRISDTISGLAIWETNFVLIADIKGLLVELRPVTIEDWCKLSAEYVTEHNAQDFFGLDIFDHDVPTAQHLLRSMARNKTAQTQEEMVARFLETQEEQQQDQNLAAAGKGDAPPAPPNGFHPGPSPPPGLPGALDT
eukprot:TRINITY_DN44512_c0_g1_i1.p1 TRINITY_DN44512_c0_g1~~TRINITY_DN44512_c0_g1_i1.p1  ORF type:complete len:406 (-),score=96.34 TRINITY_DN44512_c0_g1_i1:293-1510(-)